MVLLIIINGSGTTCKARHFLTPPQGAWSGRSRRSGYLRKPLLFWIKGGKHVSSWSDTLPSSGVLSLHGKYRGSWQSLRQEGKFEKQAVSAKSILSAGGHLPQCRNMGPWPWGHLRAGLQRCIWNPLPGRKQCWTASSNWGRDGGQITIFFNFILQRKDILPAFRTLVGKWALCQS